MRDATPGRNDRIFHMDGVQKISDVLAILVRDRSILANIDLERGRLRVEAHSVKRADSARSALELACGDGIRFHSREIVDPTSRKVQEEVAARPRQPRSADELALTRAYKDRYYASWIDELLRDMEYREQGLDPRERFDISSLRKQLGLVED